MKILYEDNHILVVYKPVNILSQGDITGDVSIMDDIKTYLKNKYQKPGNVYLALIHRLDRMVAGVMVFAKTSKAASRLNKSMIDKNIHKEYLAVVNGKFPKEVEFVDKILKKDRRAYIDDNGKLSILKAVNIHTIENLSLIKIQLITGRYNQIRLQMKEHGYPIYSDHKYGNNETGSVALISYSLSFIHPITKEKMVFEYIGDDINNIFNKFKKYLLLKK